MGAKDKRYLGPPPAPHEHKSRIAYIGPLLEHSCRMYTLLPPNAVLEHSRLRQSDYILSITSSLDIITTQPLHR